jgi:hypothetical protein
MLRFESKSPVWTSTTKELFGITHRSIFPVLLSQKHHGGSGLSPCEYVFESILTSY